MRLLSFAVGVACILSQPVMAQTSVGAPAAPTSAQIEQSIGEAARNLETMSRIMAIMGPGVSRAMQAASPSLGRAVDNAQPSLGRAVAIATPQLEAMGARMATRTTRSPTSAIPTGGDLTRGMQDAASSLEGLSRILSSVAPDLGKAYDAAAPELRGALAAARPALEEALKAAAPEMGRLAPVPAKPAT